MTALITTREGSYEMREKGSDKDFSFTTLKECLSVARWAGFQDYSLDGSPLVNLDPPVPLFNGEDAMLLPDTPVVLESGEVKLVREIIPGDVLLGAFHTTEVN